MADSKTPFEIERRLFDRGPSGTMRSFPVRVRAHEAKDAVAERIEAVLRQEGTFHRLTIGPVSTRTAEQKSRTSTPASSDARCADSSQGPRPSSSFPSMVRFKTCSVLAATTSEPSIIASFDPELL